MLSSLSSDVSVMITNLNALVAFISKSLYLSLIETIFSETQALYDKYCVSIVVLLPLTLFSTITNSLVVLSTQKKSSLFLSFDVGQVIIGCLSIISRSAIAL